MSIQHSVRKFLWKYGYTIDRFEPATYPVARKIQLLRTYQIDTLLDVGANTGEFAKIMRHDLGFRGKMLSFEPLSAAFQKLKTAAQGDPDWQVFHFALGDAEEQREINVASNLESSSFLEMLPAHMQSAPDAKYVEKEQIEIKKLDSLFDELCRPGAKVFLKIDTQGFEEKVLRGAEKSLSKIDTVQLEMSLVPLYRGELTFDAMNLLMNGKGYNLVSLEPGFSDPTTGQMLQVDGTFRRL